MDILLKENEKLKNGLKDLLEQKKIDDQKKDNIITELKEKQPYKLEINNDGLHETLKELENKIKDLKKEDNNKNVKIN